VKEWTPRDWLEQLREDVQLIAAGAAEQEHWLMEHRLPVDEIALQLNDYVLHRLLPRGPDRDLGADEAPPGGRL